MNRVTPFDVRIYPTQKMENNDNVFKKNGCRTLIISIYARLEADVKIKVMHSDTDDYKTLEPCIVEGKPLYIERKIERYTRYQHYFNIESTKEYVGFELQGAYGRGIIAVALCDVNYGCGFNGDVSEMDDQIEYIPPTEEPVEEEVKTLKK